jgi:receptor protein-tyrosine kinase
MAELATRRLAAAEADPGRWHAPPKAPPKAPAIRGLARASAAATAEAAEAPEPGVVEAPGAELARAPAAALPPGVDRQRLVAAGYLEADGGGPVLGAKLRPIAERLLARAFVPAAGRRDRWILISSATAGEGKTFAAINLALALSQAGGRPVLLIDGDPRTAGAARALGLAPEPGLTDALGAGQHLDQLVRPTGLDNLTFLAPGRPPATMTGLLASRQMAHLARELLARTPGGLVVVDGPPLLSGTEAAALAMFAGQVVLVVAPGRTTAPAIEQSLERLGEQANLWLLLVRAPTPSPPAPARGPGPAGG